MKGVTTSLRSKIATHTSGERQTFSREPREADAEKRSIREVAEIWEQLFRAMVVAYKDVNNWDDIPIVKDVQTLRVFQSPKRSLHCNFITFDNFY